MSKAQRAPHTGTFREVGLFHPPGFAPRSVRLYLPPEYDGTVPFPALFVLDGQDVFDDVLGKTGWQLHRALEGMDRRAFQPPVVVAIPHGGDWARREAELTPWPIEGRGGQAWAFLDWIVREVVPAARQQLNLLPGPLGASLGGASWGALTALIGHYRHPDQFGGALCLSPACWVGDFAIFDHLAQRPTPGISRVYLDCGALEAEGRMLPPARALFEQLRQRGYGRRQLTFRADLRGDHTERDWRRRLPRAVRFLYRK
ncbi:MAG: alpha/beta hydrolase-fold protein [Myxococcota bacterium]|nr:alpha/beta hydrolase-fold protein [Myxococcota bacterium]